MAERVDEQSIVFNTYGLFCACAECRNNDPGEIRYVGVTRQSILQRMRTHLTISYSETNPGHRTPRSRWIRKHGRENIRTFLLEVAEGTQAATTSERYWIAHLDTYGSDKGLNLSLGGEGVTVRPPARPRVNTTPGRKHSELTRSLIADRARSRVGELSGGSRFSDQQVRRSKELLWGGSPLATISDETGVSISALLHIKHNRSWTHVPWPIGPPRETPRKKRAPHSKETREKMSASHQNRSLKGLK